MIKRIRIRVAYISILVLLIISITTPQLDISNEYKPIINPKTTAYYECINSAVPANAEILFFSNSDGSYDTNIFSGDLYFLQYSIVPRVVKFQETPELSINEFDWFIAHQMQPDELGKVLELNKLISVKTCDRSEILKRTDPR